MLAEYSLNLIRADTNDYAPQLWDNVESCMNACYYGIALFEQIDERDINPNVSLELGYPGMARSGKTIFMRFLKSLFGWQRRRDDAREMMDRLDAVCTR